MEKDVKEERDREGKKESKTETEEKEKMEEKEKEQGKTEGNKEREGEAGVFALRLLLFWFIILIVSLCSDTGHASVLLCAYFFSLSLPHFYLKYVSSFSFFSSSFLSVIFLFSKIFQISASVSSISSCFRGSPFFGPSFSLFTSQLL